MRGGTRAWLALVSVCILWGTTYLAIRIALESFPPLFLMGFRYLLSGAILLAGVKLWGFHLPRGKELWLSALFGAITIGFGTGFLVIAEQWVPSGLASLFIATQPFWMVIMDWLLSAGANRPHLPTIRGLLIGLVGVALLVYPSAIHYGWGSGTIVGFLLLQLGCAGWVTGALLQTRLKSKTHPIVTGAVHQFATGVAFVVLTACFERHWPVNVTASALGGALYLIFFGAIFGYSAFCYAMAHLPAPVVSIYTFVNPVVAVWLGWLIFREPFGTRDLVAMLFIFVGIAVVKFGRAHGRHLVANEEPI
jgi:drug/metabolite transporter (DMT)-like permease